MANLVSPLPDLLRNFHHIFGGTVITPDGLPPSLRNAVMPIHIPDLSKTGVPGVTFSTTK